MKPTVIHFETAMPALADLGLEHLVPALMGGDEGPDGKKVIVITEDMLTRIFAGLSKGANAKAVRRLVMVARATAEDLLEAEASTAKETELMVSAAKADVGEAKQAVLDFFGSFGLSLPPSLASSEQGGKPAAELIAQPGDPSAGS